MRNTQNNLLLQNFAAKEKHQKMCAFYSSKQYNKKIETNNEYTLEVTFNINI